MFYVSVKNQGLKCICNCCICILLFHFFLLFHRASDLYQDEKSSQQRYATILTIWHMPFESICHLREFYSLGSPMTFSSQFSDNLAVNCLQCFQFFIFTKIHKSGRRVISNCYNTYGFCMCILCCVKFAIFLPHGIYDKHAEKIARSFSILASSCTV